MAKLKIKLSKIEKFEFRTECYFKNTLLKLGSVGSPNEKVGERVPLPKKSGGTAFPPVPPPNTQLITSAFKRN